MKYGIFLVLGLALPACGDDSEGGGDGGSDDSGGSNSNGGSNNGGSNSNGGSNNGGSSGAGTTGGTTSTGGSTGTGGSTSTGGAAGTGGMCTGGTVNIYDTPECREFFECVFDAACAQAGQQQAVCIEILKQAFSSTVPACAPAADAAAACENAKADPSIAMTYPQCAD